MRLEGKVAFISGGARGMGAAEAKLFAKEGASVVVGDLLDEEGKKLEAEINETGGQCLFLHLDVTSEANWNEAVAATVRQFGKLDIMVNNAGIGGTGSKVEDTTVEEWDETMNINAKGVFFGTKVAIAEMQKTGGGSIINISSQLGLVGTDISSPQYQASKGAVRIFTKAAAIQYAADGIRVNSVHPGPIVTAMTEQRRSEPENFALMTSRIPMGRFGRPEEVANGALYLASDESSYVTGSELVIDGGWTAQ
ncbi:MAG: cyclopentanol dehydrogenase [SAR202 cluster bacterium Casp-Chloro-G4]|nr:glucose 1-dehydrogenase [Chloroflexota bacterium]MDA1226901.1 glucose 1-dehydrogenase [Chloroflexota bacterium]PKB62063.1 MAG: cyclopentanol dehydrogenase [SAR202 cluster bacterium Casp-Chloro-G4]